MGDLLAGIDIDIYADAAALDEIQELVNDPHVDGVTTNPTLMKKAGVTHYETWAMAALNIVGSRPISFEVIADAPKEMIRQAMKLHNFALKDHNLYVKIPVINTEGEGMYPVIRALQSEGVKVNVTAVMHFEQITSLQSALIPNADAIVSVFAGRIADAGRHPRNVIAEARKAFIGHRKTRVLWASVREPFNIIDAYESRAHIVTVPPPILRKALERFGMDLDALTLETVKMFRQDALNADLTL